MKRNSKLDYIIISVLFLILISFFIYAYRQGTDWVIDDIMLIGIASLLFFTRKKYRINAYLMIIGSLGILLHGMGTFGWYATEPFGIRYDHYTHFFGALVFSLIIFNYLYQTTKHNGLPFRRRVFELVLFTIMISLGFASIIELVEYAGFRFFGPGDGILFYGTGDFGEWQNTILDMIYNLLGAMTGSMIMAFSRLKR